MLQVDHYNHVQSIVVCVSFTFHPSSCSPSTASPRPRPLWTLLLLLGRRPPSSSSPPPPCTPLLLRLFTPTSLPCPADSASSSYSFSPPSLALCLSSPSRPLISPNHQLSLRLMRKRAFRSPSRQNPSPPTHPHPPSQTPPSYCSRHPWNSASSQIVSWKLTSNFEGPPFSQGRPTLARPAPSLVLIWATSCPYPPFCSTNLK